MLARAVIAGDHGSRSHIKRWLYVAPFTSGPQTRWQLLAWARSSARALHRAGIAPAMQSWPSALPSPGRHLRPIPRPPARPLGTQGCCPQRGTGTCGRGLPGKEAAQGDPSLVVLLEAPRPSSGHPPAHGSSALPPGTGACSSHPMTEGLGAAVLLGWAGGGGRSVSDRAVPGLFLQGQQDGDTSGPTAEPSPQPPLPMGGCTRRSPAAAASPTHPRARSASFSAPGCGWGGLNSMPNPDPAGRFPGVPPPLCLALCVVWVTLMTLVTPNK